jgi:hypothetical protein
MDSSVATSGGTGGAVSCTEGDTKECYSGPETTLGVGVCKQGTQTCLPGGAGFGPCEGEVIPVAEQCATADDDDCDATPECGDHIWSKLTGSADLENGAAIATDIDGNIIIAGGFYGSVDFGKGVHTSAGLEDIFLVKLASDGVPIWSRRFGGVSSENATSLAVAANGDIYLAGSFGGTVDFGSGPLMSAGSTDIFLVKLGPAGVTLWSNSVGDASSQSIASLALDPAGNVILAGGFAGTLNFGGGALTSVGSTDVYVAKFSPGGGHLWSKRFGDMAAQSAQGVATDAAGNVVVAGNNAGGVDFGGGQILSTGGTDGFAVKLDAGGGAHIWSLGYGDPNLQSTFGVAVDPVGNAVIAGRTAGGMSFGGQMAAGDGMGEDIFVGKLDAAGKGVWVTLLASTTIKQTGGVAVDLDGNVFTTSFMTGDMDFGVATLQSAGGQDAFVTKLDPDGKALWARAFGDMANQTGRAVAAGPKGFVVVTGASEGVIDFGGGALTSQGSTDVFVAKLAP